MRFSIYTIFILILFSFSSLAVEIDDKTEFQELNYITAIAKHLGIDEKARIHISETSDPIRRLNKDLELLGLAQHLTKDVYIIYIDPNLSKRQARVVLAHELVHVKQFQEGDLVHLPKGVEFKGEIYYNDDSYFSRPYELEAMSKQNKLYRMFKHVE